VDERFQQKDFATVANMYSDEGFYSNPWWTEVGPQAIEKEACRDRDLPHIPLLESSVLSLGAPPRSMLHRREAGRSSGRRPCARTSDGTSARSNNDRWPRVHSISSGRRRQRYLEALVPRSLIRRCARKRDASVLPRPVLLLGGKAPGHCVAPATLASQGPRGPCQRILRDTAHAPTA
jgi:hypothetical protein